MTVYPVKIPDFSDSDRVEFTVETENSVLTFLCEWWDDLWHCAITLDNAEKRSCILYPGILYFPQDRAYSFKVISTKAAIGFVDLAGLTLDVAVADGQ